MHRVDLSSGKLAAIWRKDTCAVLYEIARRWPGEAAWLAFGGAPLLLVQDAASARHLLRDNGDNYKKHVGAFRGFFGESRLTTDGDRWRFLRKLSQPYLNAVDPEALAIVAGRYFEHAAGELLDARNGDGLAIIDGALSRATASVVSEAAFGFKVSDLGPRLFDDFYAILRYSSTLAWGTDSSVTESEPKLAERAARAVGEFGAIIDSEVRRRSEENKDAGDLLSVLKRQGDKVDFVGEVATLLFAGFDTSATALSWALFLLANQPDLQDTLREQTLAICGGGPVTMGDLEKMADLQAFQNEALRIFPPIPLLGRAALGTDTLAGEALAPGQTVLLSIIGLHHDPRFFSAPAEVDLARFPAGNVPHALMGQFLPFGAGKRVCGGSRFATVELTAALATLLQRLKFSLAGPEPLRFEWNASMRRFGGQRLRLEAIR